MHPGIDIDKHIAVFESRDDQFGFVCFPPSVVATVAFASRHALFMNHHFMGSNCTLQDYF